MTTERPAIDVVVPTRRRPEPLSRLLDALARQTLPRERFTLTVVNDGSDDACYGALMERYPWARYLVLPTRGGPSAARNAGALRGNADWIVFTDDDCVPPPAWLERAAAFHGADAFGGPVELVPGAARGTVARFLESSRFIRPHARENGIVYCLPSANLAVRRETFRRVGGFDERFTHAGGEDLDLTHRVNRLGRTAVDEGWVTRHADPGGLGELCRRYFRYGQGEAMFHAFAQDARPPSSPARRMRHLLGLAAKAVRPRAGGGVSYLLLAAARQGCFELGRTSGKWKAR
ncbi:MAG: glycosyltransferase [Elusimicrobia bacterium]|nr:glycosyltransferase [Elusimicrobiota bacterium]